jgi:hypothetical protein
LKVRRRLRSKVARAVYPEADQEDSIEKSSMRCSLTHYR